MRYVLKSVKSGKYIALDSASGGYPYEVDDIFDARLWSDPNRAVRYTAVMSWSDYLHPVFSMEAIKVETQPMLMPVGEALEATRV